jgi:hypothetical protein
MGDSNQIRKTGADPKAKADGASGLTIDPGPYEGIVMSHVQGTRMGQLEVYVPDWGGSYDPDNPIIVSYASPFYGTTYGTNDQNQPDSAFTTGQSYGMWMVPPDIGSTVLVTFVAGDKNRGYWFACAYNSSSHHMVPGLARNIGGEKNSYADKTYSNITGALGTNSAMPVVEYDTRASTAFNPDGLINTPRFIHPYQASVLINQGLDRDPIRGAITSSSMREVPSNVYGISTPGKALGSKPQTSLPGQQGQEAVIARSGGHSFVMDDGAKGAADPSVADGTDQLIRLRSAGGHQILMNDTENVLYIASASGMHWMEFSNNGTINVYAKGGINMRSEGVLNLQGDEAILINSKSIAINGEKGVSITSTNSVSVQAIASVLIASDAMCTISGGAATSVLAGGALTLSAIGATTIMGAMTNLTGTPGKGIKPVIPVKTNSLPNVTWDGINWQYSTGKLDSVCIWAPAHEPWVEPGTNNRPKPVVQSGGSILGGLALGIAEGALGSLAVSGGLSVSDSIGSFFKSGGTS